ncbi:MAG: DNA polymerase domain-containing protein, partial [Nitrososphaera sp.]
MTARGWLFDIYPLGDRMVFWIKQESGQTIRLEDAWTHCIYVAADARSDLQAVLRDSASMGFVKEHSMARMQERITDDAPSEVLKLTLKDSGRAAGLARRVESLGGFGKFRLYNVDLPLAQSYMYEHDLFSLAFCEPAAGKSGLEWKVSDDVMSTGYALPDLGILHLEVSTKKEARIPRFTDRIASISLSMGKEQVEIGGASEADALLALENEVARMDPDIIQTREGDSFVFPYLAGRAEQSGVALSLGREKAPLRKPARPGTSYFSYGKIYFKPAATRLHGRLHLDMENSFLWDETGIQGLYEIARICRMPLHTAARASIGKCLSSLQFYQAAKGDILVPWKPVLAEHFKTFGELLVADRGGFVFEPRAGVHESVAELDFASLDPSIMRQRIVSAETVRCRCCPDSKNRVPELGYNICEKRRGIVPKALDIVVLKRAKYKELKKTSTDPDARKKYDARQNALKWINVATFGYLGFNNAKFGRIDAHIAVCAFDRQIFLQATKVAESRGFRVLHGIVDSLWVQRPGATGKDHEDLKDAIEKETGFSISLEGTYKWIVFAQSRESDLLPAANRYFGAFEDGSIKVRGIEARRHDTPGLFVKFQMEALQVMARGDTASGVRDLMPEVRGIFEKYAADIAERRVDHADLSFAKQLSK